MIKEEVISSNSSILGSEVNRSLTPIPIRELNPLPSEVKQGFREDALFGLEGEDE